MAETKVIALKIDVQGNNELNRLQANFDTTRKQLRSLNKAEKDGIITAKQANAERARLNVELKANRNALTDQQNAILKNNDALKKNSGFVAGVKKGVGQWATSLIGVTAAIAGVTKLVGDAVRIITDFEKANSKLQAVLGATNDEMKIMSSQAKELGASTAFTASQVTELQTEFAKLGFPVDDIQNMTESTLNAAAALGSELGEQAALSGAVLKQYGLDSSEAARVNDVLAKSASSSALDFQKLATALPIVGATANTAGVSLERTTALLGTLSDRGLDASSAGTALRNIFLELSKQGLTFEEAMSQINNATDKNAVAMDLFGKRGATAGVILAETGVSVGELEAKLIDAEGAAQQMADTMLDNLSGDVTKAQSAWEGFILSLEDGEGTLSNIVRDVTQLGTAYLGMLTAINEGETAQEQLNAVGAIWGKELGILNNESAKYTKNLADNANNIAVLDEWLANNKITTEQYNLAIQKLANGWKRASKDIKEGQEEIAAADTVIEESTELTDEEVEAINKKAKARAKAKREAELKAIEDREAQDTQDEQGGFDAEIDKLIEEEIQKAEIPASIRKEIRDRETEEFIEDLDKRQAAEKRALEQTRAIEQAKRDARRATFDITADFFNLGASLAKEGSIEQKALASAAALVQTYQAAQAAYLSQLSIPTPSAPFRAAAAAAVATATGLANVAKINAVKAQRGMLIQGNSHALGGVPFSVGGQLGFEAEGGEAIINKKSTAMFAPLLSHLNQLGGGVAFKYGGIPKKYANGGLSPSSTATSSQQALATLGIDMDSFAETIVTGINDKEVINVATNTTQTANEVVNAQQTASF